FVVERVRPQLIRHFRRSGRVGTADLKPYQPQIEPDMGRLDLHVRPTVVADGKHEAALGELQAHTFEDEESRRHAQSLGSAAGWQRQPAWASPGGDRRTRTHTRSRPRAPAQQRTARRRTGHRGRRTELRSEASRTKTGCETLTG